jgi:chemotaxis protein MotB
VIHRWLLSKWDPRNETIWLTIYADLITNMMLVFLSLYGLTVMGNDALAKAIESMKFQEIEHPVASPTTFSQLVPALRYQFQNESNITISEGSGAIRIELGEDVLFASGQAAPKPKAHETLRNVARLLKNIPNTVVVEGHTDSVPLQRGSAFENNWQLSLARAMSVVKMLEENGIPSGQLAAAAYGENRPTSSNSTALGRGLNRRVEIALFRDFPFDPKIGRPL